MSDETSTTIPYSSDQYPFQVKNWKQFQHFTDRKPPWIKLYREILDDLEFHKLDPEAARALFLLWLLASETEGYLPDINVISFRLRLDIKEVSSIISRLSHYIYQRDITTISPRHQDDPLERETDREERETDIRAKPSVQHQTEFDEFWKAYPKRKGANPKVPARLRFDAAVKNGTAASTIIDAARRYAEDDRGNVGTPYIAQAMVWLNQHRWEDYPSRQPVMLNGAPQPAGVFVKEGTPGWEAWQKHLKKTTGRGSPCVNFGWTFPTLLPPEITHQESFTEETPI